MAKQVFKKIINNRQLIVEHGQLAKQASGAVLIRYGETVVLVTATVSNKVSETDFFPLTVIFQEKLYSVGKIPGGFLKREGKPLEYGTLSARVIDRALRPLFSENFRNEVQIIINVLAVDNDSDVRIVSLFGASLALGISKIPFAGPVAGALLTVDQKQNIIVNPTLEQLNTGQMELIVTGTTDAINMVEAGAKEVSEATMLEAILRGHKVIVELVAFQNEIIAKVGQPKMDVTLFTVRSEIIAYVNEHYATKLIAAAQIKEKVLRYEAIQGLTEQALEHYPIANDITEKDRQRIILELKTALYDVVRQEVRRQILIDKTRLDNRRLDEIRPLTSEIDILPVVHGSALFTRGETQVLSVVTLGALGENQIIDGITDEDGKRFMHHYNFPPFSVGETGRMGPPSRREIGHGALGEKALLQIIPSEKVFPYTIRIVSEVLESNGSTSQASICAATLALMAAGVPITAPVVGIAMGLVKEDDNYTILTDIQGMEDHLGDMDFKVAGTAQGICALQMDIKIAGINETILQEALLAAKKARLQILDNVLATIVAPRTQLAPTAPKMKTFMIPVDKIREVIGPGGKMITAIIEKADDVKIDIEDDGQVTIYHKDYPAIEKAYELIKAIAMPVEIGAEMTGPIVKIEKFGAFVNLKENVDGLIHISKLAEKRVEKTEDIVQLNDLVKVKVLEVDSKGKIKLQLLEVLPKK
ncbi:MAG: polyribonucleotide nucleotidyltransferase [Spiroplasma poulsonii]|uniref:Polyribonucleotide nucleotidyltransferase n=1 Tax=Spiroplasma poulsonii TaxID=2138 RepID=A0A2P6FAQ1_9MOLU|nr:MULTISPECIES: polyribonucleotide nucleotidyltransferase [Spiroplasma]KAF0851756.1 Polyribonucleotide nucleotidyltransferase [Spiroplasma poulsonii]MBH8622855.1 polyribonucleotide nucleotidyltransferase [Spiroplasma sp. hyd1]MBW1242115.1 polyribonucleotide nucleotidyltransferase [Spiroplasma poulsonii]PQM30545.1 Polyribonucleotide nucleotidyltransferase [Spiroplasma poulsonii]PWF95519.1 Polyribonucleotide nucleotidyltransferase [Spiroplasma poulsonii]